MDPLRHARGLPTRLPVLTSACAALVLAGLCAWGAAPADVPVIHLYVFLSPDCPTCEPVERQALEKTARRLGCRIEPRYFDIESMENYRLLVAFERRFGDDENDLPVVIVGDRLLGSVEEVKKHLPGVLAELAAAGGAPAVPLPSAGEIARAVHIPVVRGAIHVTFFDSPGCRQCSRTERMLRYYQSEIEAAQSGKGLLVIERFLSEDVESRIWQEVLSERAGLPEDERLVVPAVFLGKDARVAKKITDSALTGLVRKYRSGSAPPEPATDAERAAARARLNARFRGIGLVTVLAGGLVDGINPCAFVTLIFLVGYLAATGRRGREVLLVGGAFTAAVFCAYFLTGVGLAGILQKLDSLPRISRAFTWGLVALTFLLAALSAWDTVLAWRGRGGEATLALPGFLRRRVSMTVAREFRTRTLVGAALVTGFLVSLFEFVCTGQIYLPLIRLMIAFSATRTRALFFLAAYNTAFVVPLVITFLAVYAGSSSQQLTRLFQRHLTLSKLLATLLFVTMGVLLIVLR